LGKSSSETYMIKQFDVYIPKDTIHIDWDGIFIVKTEPRVIHLKWVLTRKEKFEIMTAVLNRK
jgi:hypothetical protein